ncbi:MAG: GNAT family N-acetyltransferase, partial [Actinomycetota bacterium]
MEHAFRPYDPTADLAAVARIWTEVGWLESPDKTDALGAFLAAGNAEVAVMNGEAECAAHWMPGSVRYQDQALGMCAITAITTSQIGRKQGFASDLTARALAQGAAAGHAVGMLGMFEQGFYDRLGFGTGAYDFQFQFDPANLAVDHIPYRVPERIALDAHADIQRAMARRLTAHGSVVIDPPGVFAADVGMRDKIHALGYRDADGELTHFLLGALNDGHGPWEITFLAYRTPDQLLELFRLLRELSDQIRLVKMIEPAHIQLQALLREPIRERWRSNGTDKDTVTRAIAWYQLRMLDVDACVSAREFEGRPVRFNLTLTDPVARRLEGPWQGVAGDYTVTIGAPSGATVGHEDGLPLLTAG